MSEILSSSTSQVDFGDGLYSGELNDGVFHGQGKATYTSGDVYVGEWRNDAFHGKGTYTWADGDVYSGDYQHDKQHGQGILKDTNGTYNGEWVDDLREGEGKQTYTNGDIYIGEWHQDKRHGRGKMTLSNGSSYEGEWINDTNHGTGVTRNSGGDTYEGEFLNNKPHGRGHYRWADGASYVGYFVDGVKHGEGCERLPDGTWVAGNWVSGEHDKKQPVHKVDPDKLSEHEELLQQTLARLDAKAIQPMSVERLKAKSAAKSTLSGGGGRSAMADAAEEGAASSSAEGGSKSPTSANQQSPSSPLSPARPLFTERDLEGWQPMKMLGRGSFGAVYEAGLNNGKIVCVKIVELGSISEKTELEKLQNEINLMKRLNHPNIVQYYGCLEDKEKNTLNIFMEYVTGGSINHYIKRFKKIPTDTVRQWAFQMVNGVEYLHDQGIVHRDIKGDNILVTMDGVLKLADFGCSKAIDDVCSATHGCKTMVGTPYWMAPEVIKCEPTGYGVKSDIWSVGCTVVEMVTGKPPWPECNSMWAAVYKIANSTGLPSEIPKDLPADMMDFLEQCFVRDPSQRPSAKELRNHPLIRVFAQ